LETVKVILHQPGNLSSIRAQFHTHMYIVRLYINFFIVSQ